MYKSKEQRVQITEYSPITKLCFVIAFSPFGRRTSFPNRREESLVISMERSDEKSQKGYQNIFGCHEKRAAFDRQPLLSHIERRKKTL